MHLRRVTFQSYLRAKHFNESLAHKSPSSMVKIMPQDELYIKGEKKSADKKETPTSSAPHTS